MTTRKAQTSHAAPVLDCCWHAVRIYLTSKCPVGLVVGQYYALGHHTVIDLSTTIHTLQDGTKILTASCDKTCKLWDLQSNQAIDVAQHAAPIKSVHWIQSPNYSVVVTGSWDKTLKVSTWAVTMSVKGKFVAFRNLPAIITL